MSSSSTTAENNNNNNNNSGWTQPGPPSPLDDPSVSDPLDCPAPLNWGLLSCSRVCHDFALAMRHLPSQRIVACSARNNLDKAQQFAALHDIPNAYDNYDDVIFADDNDVQIVYVGNVHYNRLEIVSKCIDAGKHVLVEKPFACTYEDAEQLVEKARAKQPPIFVLEGMWTRFFPAVEMARKMVVDDKVIGEIVNVVSDFNFNASDSGDPYPTSFFYDRKLGGGCNLLVGPYPSAQSTMFFNGRRPDQIMATGQLDAISGVALQCAVCLRYPSTSNDIPALVNKDNDDDNDANVEKTPKLPGAGVACLTYGMLGESDECTKVVGTKGRLTIETPCHCPTRITIEIKAQGRGTLGKVLRYEFPLPAGDPAVIEKTGGYNYPNSVGFAYEAAAVARCIAAGKNECPQFTLDETLVCAKINDDTRIQLGVKSVHED